MRTAFLTVLLMLQSLALVPPSAASDELPLFTLIGDAEMVDGRMRLTANAADQVSAVWLPETHQAAKGFTATFTFQIMSGSSCLGEGMAFVIQYRDGITIGEGGPALGYGGLPGPGDIEQGGIDNGVAIEFDLVANAENNGPFGEKQDLANAIAVQTRGRLDNSANTKYALAQTADVPLFGIGAVHQAKVTYLPGLFAIYLDDLESPVLIAGYDLDDQLAIDGGWAWIGFTAATSSCTAQQDILSFTFGPPEPTDFADPAFERTWQRTDRPVEQRDVDRTWMWGPGPFTTEIDEAYVESPDGTRSVQYFDKTRMELTYPDIDPESPWRVTNGLLVVELVTGKRQAGNDTFEQFEPARVPIAGDPDDRNAPTYATFGTLLDVSPLPADAIITQRVYRDGQVVSDESLRILDVRAGPLVPETQHRVASVFWDFLHSQGEVYLGDERVVDDLFDPWYYASGLPITEAYWTTVLVGGTPRDVLVQVFERRVLTYTPGNPEGWQVEAGNVGRHYFRWRYLSPPVPLSGRVAISRDGLFVVDADGSQEMRLTPDEIGVGSLDWALDGTKIAFTGRMSADDDSDIFVVNADGTDLHRLVHRDGYDSEPRWSPDGELLVFESMSDNYEFGLSVVRADGTDFHRLANGNEARFLSWLPDSRHVAYNSPGSSHNITMEHVETGEVSTLDLQHDFTSGEVWSPDGSGLAYWTRGQLMIAEPDGSNPRSVADMLPSYYRPPDWSPDSKHLLFYGSLPIDVSPWIGPSGLWIVDADGTDLRRLTPECNGGSTSWSQDGVFISCPSTVTTTPSRVEIRILSVEYPEWRYPIIPDITQMIWSPVP